MNMTKRAVRNSALLAGALAITVCLIGCQQPVSPDGASSTAAIAGGDVITMTITEGEFSISEGNGGMSARTILPGAPTFSSYELLFECTAGGHADVGPTNVATASPSLSLPAGTWTATVTGKDAGSNAVAWGSVSFTLTPGGSASPNITLNPIAWASGQAGAFAYSVTLTGLTLGTTNPTDVEKAEIVLNGTGGYEGSGAISILLVDSGVVQTAPDLTTVSGSVYSGTKTPLAAGQYNAVLTVTNHGGKIARVNEVVRINQNLTTTWSRSVGTGGFVTAVPLAGTVTVAKPGDFTVSGVTVTAYSDSGFSTAALGGPFTADISDGNKWNGAIPASAAASPVYLKVTVTTSSGTVSTPAGPATAYTISGAIPDNGRTDINPSLTIRKVTFNKNHTDADGTYTEASPAVKAVASGGTVSAPATPPTRDNYAFVGWYEEAAGTTEWNPATAINADTEVFARWAQAKIVTGGSTAYYETLAAAFTAAVNGDTVELLCDITRTSAQSISIASSTSITLSGGSTAPYYSIVRGASGFGNLIEKSGTGTLTLTNITLDGRKGAPYNYTATNSLLWLNNGTVNLNAGATLKDNNSTSTNAGGGVYIYSGTLNMNGATISGNSTAGSGGGVYITANNTFTLTSGDIIGNTAAQSAGGVYAVGTFTMNGGTITGNTSNGSSSSGYGGGGVSVNGGTSGSSGVFTLNGGTIDNNTANAGGGVNINGTIAAFTYNTGGVIGAGNSAGGLGDLIYKGSSSQGIQGTAVTTPTSGTNNNSGVAYWN